MLKKLSACPADNRRAFRVMHGRQARWGFTLFEVSISLVLVAFGVISVMALFPIGIKAEQMARMRIFAAVKAEEILDSFATLPKDNPGIDVEAPFAWEVAVAHRPLVPDLEARMLSSRNGIMSVPMDIVRRLESENDEIQKVIQQGGHLYYSKATGTSGFQESAEGFRNSPKDPLTQRVVFAVMGSAQNNAVSILPQKAWPYYNAYPSPPSFGLVGGYHTRIADWHNNRAGTPDTFKAIYFRDAEQPSNPPDSTDVSFMETNDRYFDAERGWWEYAFSLWEGTNGGMSLGSGETATGSLDPDIRLVFTNGYRPYLLTPLYNYKDLADKADFPVNPNGFYRTLLGATRYVQAAWWYCNKKGIDGSYFNLSVSPSDSSAAVAQAQTQANLFRSVPEKDKWKYVQAMRFLAHATSCLTAYPGSSTGISIPSATFPFAAKDKLSSTSVSIPDVVIDNNEIVYYHELAMRMAMLYAASQPYDWGAPRPSQRALFTDNPLLEYDLISGPNNPKIGQISGAVVGVTGSQWRPIPARTINNIGRSASFPNTPIDPSATWGNSANFTLTKQFEPAERCRELVFWSVDWLSYVDAETAPGILEASRIPFAAPIIVPTVPDLSLFRDTNDKTMRLDYWRSRTQFVNSFLNPEMDRAFSNDVSAFPTGFHWEFWNPTTADDHVGQNYSRLNNGTPVQDGVAGAVKVGVNINANEIWWGTHYLRSGDRHYSCHGADRNGNRILDRGPVPKSTRLRATLLARYNFYDPRLTLRLR